MRRPEKLCWAASNLKAKLGSRVMMRSEFWWRVRKMFLGLHPILNGDSEWKGNNLYWVCAGTANFFWDRILEANFCAQGLL